MNTSTATQPDIPDFQFDALSEAHNYRKALLHEFGPFLRGSVIEVGAGIGQVACELRKKPEIEKLVSIEPDWRFCSYIHNHFPDLDLIHGTIDDLNSQNDWNAVLSVNVLEHIETDQKELTSYHRLLSPAHGALCLFVPARPEIYAPIDKDFGHFRRYTRTGLCQKLETAGFSVERLRYYNVVGYLAWWISFCLLKKRSFDQNSVRFFDRAIFPAVHWSETHISAPPLGQSLLAVAIAR
jgi:SAM-dependent methyltransferase